MVGYDNHRDFYQPPTINGIPVHDLQQMMLKIMRKQPACQLFHYDFEHLIGVELSIKYGLHWYPEDYGKMLTETLRLSGNSISIRTVGSGRNMIYHLMDEPINNLQIYEDRLRKYVDSFNGPTKVLLSSVLKEAANQYGINFDPHQSDGMSKKFYVQTVDILKKHYILQEYCDLRGLLPNENIRLDYLILAKEISMEESIKILEHYKKVFDEYFARYIFDSQSYYLDIDTIRDAVIGLEQKLNTSNCFYYYQNLNLRNVDCLQWVLDYLYGKDSNSKYLFCYGKNLQTGSASSNNCIILRKSYNQSSLYGSDAKLSKPNPFIKPVVQSIKEPTNMTTTETKTVATTSVAVTTSTESFTESLIRMAEEANIEGGKRNAVRGVVATGILGASLALKGSDFQYADAITAALNTKVGEAGVKAFIGFLGPLLPQFKDNPVAQAIFKECRNQGAETGQQVVFSTFFKQFMPMLETVINKIMTDPDYKNFVNSVNSVKVSDKTPEEPTK